MIKTNFLVNEDEKARILNLHENATKKQYLVLEDDMDISEPYTSDDMGNKESDEAKGSNFVSKSMKNPNMQAWMIENERKYPRFIRFLRKEEKIDKETGGNAPNIYRKIGKYLRKNPDVLISIEKFAKKDPSKLGI